MGNPEWDVNLLLISLIISVGLNYIVFILAFILQTDVFTDFTGSVTYITVCLVTLFLNDNFYERQIIVTACIIAARVYLGLFLGYRAHQRSGDKRFDEIRPYFWKFFIFWTFQIVWAMLTLLPVIYVNSRQSETDLYIMDYVILAFFAIGLTFQVLGDIQKFIFKNSGSKGIMVTGVWSLTRHPNYFGEMCMWWSVYAFSVVQWYLTDQDDFYWIIITVLSPLFTMCILLFASGIPTAEGKALKRIEKRGALDDWNEYASKTPPVIPCCCYENLPSFIKSIFCCEFEMYQYRGEELTSGENNSGDYDLMT